MEKRSVLEKYICYSFEIICKRNQIKYKLYVCIIIAQEFHFLNQKREKAHNFIVGSSLR